MQPYPISDSDSLELAFAGPVKAGFPSPAEEVREKLDLVKLLVQHSASTFFFRIDGISMVDADMDEGDIIIVDRGIDPYNGCKAVCFIDGEYTVKRVEIHEDGAILLPCNEKNTKYKPIPVGPDNDFLIWGVVTWVIKKVPTDVEIITPSKISQKLINVRLSRLQQFLRLVREGLPS